MTYPDLAEALQARILVDQIAEKDAHTPRKRPKPNERRALETHIATLEEAVAKAEALGEQRCQEAQTAAKRVEALEVHVAALKEAVAKAEALSEQRRQEAQLAAKRAEGLVAELIEMTSELVEMSKWMAEQAAATEKVRAELDDYRSRSTRGRMIFSFCFRLRYRLLKRDRTLRQIIFGADPRRVSAP